MSDEEVTTQELLLIIHRTVKHAEATAEQVRTLAQITASLEARIAALEDAGGVARR